MSKNRNKWIALLLLAALLLTGCGSEKPAPEPERAPAAAAEAESARKSAEQTEPSLRISELMTKNRATLADGAGEFPDWVEIENVSGESVSLEGWSLTDRASRVGDKLGEGSLAAGERKLLFLESFGLSEGETLLLRDAEGRTADSALCLSAEADCSCALIEGEWTVTREPSPGYPNGSDGYDAWQASLDDAFPLQINEVCVANLSERWLPMLGDSDWVELKNVSEETLLLSDFCLSDDRNERTLFRLPENWLAPGGTWLLRCGKNPELPGYAPLCRNFSLDDSRDELYLSRADGTLCDYVSLRGIPYGCSFGRMPGEKGFFYFADPTPGADNTAGQRRVSVMPWAAEPDGIYDEVESVTVELCGEGTIRYTLDGSLPTEASPVYEEPLTLEKTSIVRAVAVQEGALPSRVLTLNYLINEGHSLPVLSLVADRRRDFEQMYESGRKGYEIPGSLSLYEQSGPAFSAPCGIKMHGETSLILTKKNMSVRFRGAYGQEKLEYDLFGGGVTQFTNLVLRAGQDYNNTIIRNELCENMALSASDSILIQRNRPCVLYINGKYCGIYALTEKTNEQMAADHFGVSRESVTVLESQISGDSELYREVFSFCNENDLSLDENYRTLCERLDVDSLIDWCLIEGWCANQDLTYGNLRYFRSTENDGKWRLIFYDLDSTLAHPEDEFHNIFSPYQLEARQVSRIIAPLLKNEQFRDKLLTRAGELLRGPLSDEKLLAEFERLTAEIEPEVERDYQRLGFPKEKWLWNLNYFRDLIRETAWAENGARQLCSIFRLTEEEQERYFDAVLIREDTK